MNGLDRVILESVFLISLSIVVACLFAAIGGIIRYTTRPPGGRISVFWLIRMGIFAGVPFSIVGMTCGYMTGLSRVGAISALVPAALTLVGAVGVYLLGRGGKSAVIAAFAVVDFSVLMLLGALIGAQERGAADSLENQETLIEKEFELNQFRHSLGLPPAKPSKDKSDEQSDSDK